MTRHEIRRRRQLKSMGRDKKLIIMKTKRLIRYIDTPLPITYWNWVYRFKSLFTFKRCI